jgi:hypothetical protein
MKFAVVVLLALMVGATPAFAQEQGQLPEQRFDELAKWLKEYHAWEKWFEVWGNRVVHNFDDQLIWDRKQRPEPPVWLEAECQGYFDADGLLASACHIFRHWDDQPLLILQRRNSPLATSGGMVDDRVVKSSFFKRVHVTGLWMQARYPDTPAYGILGMQVGVFETGRFTLPAVGVMAVMSADGQGGHDWKIATTLGVGYRICDFVPPFMKRQASLHINFARTSLHGRQDQQLLPAMSNLSLFGLSVSAKRGR